MDALPDFVKLAESYGHIGIKVEKEQDLKPALIEASMVIRDRVSSLVGATVSDSMLKPRAENKP
jgi:thiamine pyrophosphate-dependent acetolactate synthase large subunit-like protein